MTSNFKAWLVVGCLSFPLVGCTTQPVTPPYSDFIQKYEAMKSKPPERVVFDFNASCNDAGDCIVTKTRLEDAARVITLQNDALEHAVTAGNQRLDAVGECEYANAKKDEAILAEEKRADKIELTGTIKQIILGGMCAAFIFAR